MFCGFIGHTCETNTPCGLAMHGHYCCAQKFDITALSGCAAGAKMTTEIPKPEFVKQTTGAVAICAPLGTETTKRK